MASHRILQTAAVATVAYRKGKKRATKGSNLKQSSVKGASNRTNTGGRAQPPYTITTVSPTALVPGQGPPMSSTQSGRGAVNIRKIQKKRRGRR